MQRKIAKPAQAIEEKRNLVNLPNSIHQFGVFPSITTSELMRIKAVSRYFNLCVNSYIKLTEKQIFYAVSPYDKVEIGTLTFRGIFEGDKITRTALRAELISTFKYNVDISLKTQSNSSMRIFRTEDKALNSLISPQQALYTTQIDDDSNSGNERVQVTPIYKVQVVKRLIIASDNVSVEKSSLLPISASIKFKFFQNQPIQTFAENVDLKKFELEPSPERPSTSNNSSSNKCIVM